MHPETIEATPAEKLTAGIFLNDVEVAELCNCALQTVRNWRTRGTGPKWVKLGGLVRYPPANLKAFIAGDGA